MPDIIGVNPHDEAAEDAETAVRNKLRISYFFLRIMFTSLGCEGLAFLKEKPQRE